MSLFSWRCQITKIIHVSLCDTLDKFTTWFILRTFITQHIKMSISTVHFLVQHEYRFLIVSLFCFLKEVPLGVYDPTIINFVEPKECNTFTVNYLISILRPRCVCISVHKIIFIPNFAQYIGIGKYIKTWNRMFIFVRRRVVSSILTVSYQRIWRNRTEYILKHISNQRCSHSKRVNGDQFGISNMWFSKSLL